MSVHNPDCIYSESHFSNLYGIMFSKIILEMFIPLDFELKTAKYCYDCSKYVCFDKI